MEQPKPTQEELSEMQNRPVGKTWFFTDSTGRIFPAGEKEAFNILTENSRWRRQDIKMIGMSDGTEYERVIRESKVKTEELGRRIAELKDTLQKYIAGHDRLLFEEFVDKDDPRVVRARKLINDTEAELAPLQEELKQMKTNIVKRAEEAELEKARGNLVNPRDFSVIIKSDGSGRGDAIVQNFANSKRVI